MARVLGNYFFKGLKHRAGCELKKAEHDVGVRELAPGLWIWRAKHPGWRPEADWQPIVTSTFVETGGERLVLDPLAPAPDSEVWQRLDRHPPTVSVVLMPDHVRDVDLFVRRYGARGLGPLFFFPEDLPRTRLEPIRFDSKLPGGPVALYDGRGRAETPIWLPEHRVIVFGDALTERSGQLRVWDSPSHERRELPALRAMFELPFERVIVSHCDQEPVHSRSAFERALKLPPWRG